MRKHTLILSILLHLLMLTSFVLVWHPVTKQQKMPSMYVPSYTYSEPKSSPAAAMHEEKKEVEKKETEQKEVKEEEQKKPDIAENVIPLEKAATTKQQIKKASSYATNSNTKVTEAINLVGDKDTVPQPLIKLLGKALGRTLKYPKIAVDFRVRGIAYVGFMLHPDGTVSNVEVVQSSNAGVLDSEAARAVQAMSPLKDVGKYVPKIKPMVVGIIFN